MLHDEERRVLARPRRKENSFWGIATMNTLPVICLGLSWSLSNAFVTQVTPTSRALPLCFGTMQRRGKSLNAQKGKHPAGMAAFNPFEFDDNLQEEQTLFAESHLSSGLAALTSMALVPVGAANAVSSRISKGDFDPDTFKPVCGASDGFYRFLQKTTQLVVGDDAFIEYGPLIAGGLLRIRLELCVVESFFNEAVTPFIQKNGLSWVLPLHETVETFLAGSVFAVASTFILVGSTKIICVVATYADFLFGAPCRLLGGFTFDRALGKPVTLEIGIGPLKAQIIGPKKTSDDESDDPSKLDLSKVPIAQYPILLVSGAVKAAGEVSGVSTG
jgi:hypothetical protein